jgi:hypothetical protein
MLRHRTTLFLVWLLTAGCGAPSRLGPGSKDRKAAPPSVTAAPANESTSSAPIPIPIRQRPEAFTMKPLFRPFTFFKDVPPFAFPGLDQFHAEAPAPKTWPAVGGGAGRTGRSGEPLLQDRFKLAWSAPLGDATRPTAVMVGAGRIVVAGADRYGMWSDSGSEIGFIMRSLGGAWLDVAKQRLLVDDENGITIYTLDAKRESSLPLVAPSDGVTREVIAGPGALVLLTIDAPPHGTPKAVVETRAEIRDYSRVKNSTLYGVEPLAGVQRDDDARVLAAAGPSGPVLATSAGLEWRDWQLNPLQQVPLAGRPIALAVDDQNQAYLLSIDVDEPHLHRIPGLGGIGFDQKLAGAQGPYTSLLVAANGQIYVRTPQGVLAFAADGKALWRSDRKGPAALSANGVLMVSGETLDAITSDGQPLTIWNPPMPLVTPPVLANGHIIVASSEQLYVLEPQ